MTFHVGQKVVCVDDHSRPEYFVPNREYKPWRDEGLRVNAIYTVRAICHHPDGTSGCIKVSEIHRAGGDVPFGAFRFRPLVTKSIQLFRDIAQGVSDGKPIIPDDQPQQVPLSPETIRELIGGGAIRI